MLPLPALLPHHGHSHKGDRFFWHRINWRRSRIITAMSYISSSPAGIDPELHKSTPISEEDGKDYTLTARSEILTVLRALIQQGSLMTMHFNQGQDFLLTSVLALDDTTLILDAGSNATGNARALASERLICVGQLDKIKVQFALGQLTAVEYQGRPAFRASLPATLQRLQRREYYRLTLPILQPLVCLIPPQHDDGRVAEEELHVLDISGGGVGLLVKNDGLQLNTDARLNNCRIVLPQVGTLICNLRVRSLYEITLRSGQRHKRAGAQFLDLANAMQQMLQRYILKSERERKLRETA